MLAATAQVAAAQGPVDPRPANNPEQKPAFAGQTDAPEQKLGVAFDVVTVAEGLQNPWGVAFLPDGKMLITERPGTAARASARTASCRSRSPACPPCDARGQGGLLDVALDPAFAKNNLIYWSYSEPRENKARTTPRSRAASSSTMPAAPRVDDVQVIYHQTPSLHSTAALRQPPGVRPRRHAVRDAGRSLDHRGPHAGAEAGQRHRQDRAHQRRRLDPEGQPVRRQGRRAPEIWSFGHRNVQAAALHPTTGELWEVEHGTRGGDEINIARKGKDYGWPTIAYGIEYRGGHDHRRHHSSRPAWSSRSTTGIRSSGRAA